MVYIHIVLLIQHHAKLLIAQMDAEKASMLKHKPAKTHVHNSIL